jgi:hypothetical protein
VTNPEPGRKWTAATRTLAVAMATVLPTLAAGWIYPEHRDIATEAIARLSPADRAAVERLWAESRVGYAAPMCEPLSAGDQGLKPACIDFAALPALSGDHACSPAQVLDKVLPGPWIIDVARVSAETRAALAASTTREERLQAAATNNLKLQVSDPEYATRAGANNAHFHLPRTGDDMLAYVRTCVAEGTPLNALGLYGQYHIAALALAQRLASGKVAAADRAAVARDIIALEGYSIHWLEDIYASGHSVGTWGSNAWRKGTHDYYNEFGIDTVDWKGRTVVTFGDGNIKPPDLARASAAVEDSLRQLVEALQPGDALGTLAQSWGLGPEVIRSFDSCKETGQPSSKGSPEMAAHFQDQIERMPRPALGPGEVHVPRYRDELGPFVGVYGQLSGGVAFGSAARASATGSVGAGIRLGFGSEGLTGSVGTGILFVEAGFEAETAQTNGCGSAPGCAAIGTAALFPQVPGRTGLSLGMRMPFWLIPGDMLILGPVLALASPGTLSTVGVAAASGGVIPFERSFSTGAGVFQVVAGREARAVLFGYFSDLLGVVPGGTLPDGSNPYVVVQFKSVQLEFPVLEWTPFRTFATQLTFAAQVQLGFSVGLIASQEVLYPAGGTFSTGPSWSIWLRGVFDGRYFFGSREDLEAPR